jgi:lycopene beta-cyclase
MPDSSEQYYDFIVAGAGAAGLATAWNLVNHPDFGNRRMLLVDRDFSQSNTKTWCFWDDRNLPLPKLVYKSWDRIHVATDISEVKSSINSSHFNRSDFTLGAKVPVSLHRFSDNPIDKSGFANGSYQMGKASSRLPHLNTITNSETDPEQHPTLRYSCIRSGDWSKVLMRYLSQHPAVTVLKDEIKHLEHRGDHAVMQTSTGTWRAGYALQSVQEKSGKERLLYSLKQHFLGLEVRSHRPVFDPGAMTLMDFRVQQKGATAFMYVLPFTETHAMIEYTLFSDTLLEEAGYIAEVTRYLLRQYGLDTADYEIISTERGCIPMEIVRPNPSRTPSASSHDISRVISIGAVSGITKPSTGYAFTRILKHSKVLSDWLLKPAGPPPKFTSSRRFRFYDLLLMRILVKRAHESVPIFGALFQKNDMATIFRFLDESTNPAEEIRIFWNLPWAPFLKSLTANAGTVLTGRF